MKRWWIVIGAVALVGVVVVAILAVAPKKVVPEDIARQLTSTLFVPQVKDIASARKTVKYNSSIKLLTYIVTFDKSTLTISEQPTPDSFVDVPAVYGKVITSMNGYQTFVSPNGTVDLTRPKNNGGDQTAVMNTKGTLMFIKASDDLTQAQWQQFFLTMTTQSTT